MSWTLLRGDCRKVLATLPDASVDAVVTDPPYELGFMGKAWDAAGIAYDTAMWAEVLRVLKPGGHLLAFGGTRTYHRMACAIEDAGFEIRDSIHWLYGSGFPKSLNVSKAIDKQRDDRAEVYEVTAWVRQARDAAGITNRDIDAAFGANGMGRHWTDVPPHGMQPAVPTLDQVPTLLDVLGVAADEVPEDVRRLLWDLNGRKGQPGENWARREVVGTADSTLLAVAPGEGRDRPPVTLDITAPATPEAEQWQGWGTALKPAHEPVVVARKPLVGTVAANVLAHGTGAINVDGCRVGTDPVVSRGGIAPGSGNLVGGPNLYREPTTNLGRWPANVVLTHHADCTPSCTSTETVGGGAAGTSGFAAGYETGDGFVGRDVPTVVWDCHPECPTAVLDGQSGTLTSGNLLPGHKQGEGTHKGSGGYAGGGKQISRSYGGDSGGASRFFTQTEWNPDLNDLTSFRYVAKPDRAERDAGLNANFHPTVKPLDLMRWLVRLVTPPGGVVLDPFAGSGTTLAAALLEGVDCIGVELTDDYLPIIEGRCQWAERQARFGPVQGPTKPKPTDREPTLFDQ